MKKKFEIKLQIVLSVFTMVFAIYIGTTLGNKMRLDFTEEKLYTLSDGSVEILKKVNTPINLKLYYSKTAAKKGTEGLRAFNNYYYYVRDLLQEYVSHSKNNITLTVIDPRPDTADEEEAQAYGLKRFSLSETEKYFFGLVAVSDTGTEKVIEFFDPNKQEMLEYDITKLLYSVTDPKKKTVGVISATDILQTNMSPYMLQLLQMQGRQGQKPWIIADQMNEFYQTRDLAHGPQQWEGITTIDGVDILLVIHPRNLPQNVLYAIDQFVMGGGKLVVLTDPHALSIPAENPSGNGMVLMQNRPRLSKSDLNSLLAKWGVTTKANVFAGDRALSGVGRTNPYSPPSRLLPVLNCDTRCVSETNDIISKSLKNLTFFFPGALVLSKDVKDLTITPLVTTTDGGNTYEANPSDLNSPENLLDKFKEGSTPQVIGAKIVGKFKSNYGSRPRGLESKKDEAGKVTKVDYPPHLSQAQKEGAVVVFADVDFIFDQFAYRQTIMGVTQVNDNSSLLLNTLENMSGSNDLLSIRSKGRYTRTFDIIDKIEYEAERATADKVSEINQSIQQFQSELEALGQKAQQGGQLALLRNEGIAKKKELAKKIASKKKELRDVKRLGREKTETIGLRLQYFNTLFVPFIIIGVAFYLHNRRKVRHLSLTNKSTSQGTGA